MSELMPFRFVIAASDVFAGMHVPGRNHFRLKIADFAPAPQVQNLQSEISNLSYWTVTLT
jgi:hypothetical protein